MNAVSAPLAIGLVLATFAGCSKKDKPKENGAAPTPPVAVKTEAAPIAPAALSVEVLKTATGLAASGTPWAEALAAVEARLGKVTTIHGTEHRWAARTGDTCAFLSLALVAGDAGTTVGAVQGPIVATASGDADEWNRCLDSMGAQVTEDSTAPEPPAAGELATVTSLLDGVDRKPSSWVGATVSLSGFYVSSSASASGEVETTTVSIAETKGNLKVSIGCTLEAGAVPAEFARWDAVRVSGTVHGDFGGGLKDCNVALEE